MRKKNKLIIICSLVIIFAGVIGLYKSYSSSIDSNKYLSSSDESECSFFYHENEKITKDGQSFHFGKFDGKWSLMGFTSSKGDKIIINDKTQITKGKFYIVVLDSDYNIIAKKNELNQKGNIKFTTPKDGKYIIRIVGASAGGNFNIKVSSGHNIYITHKDFM